MLSQKTVKEVTRLIKGWNGCRCQIGEKIVQLVGDCGDRCEAVEVNGSDVYVESGGVWSWHGKFCSCQSCQSR